MPVSTEQHAANPYSPDLEFGISLSVSTSPHGRLLGTPSGR